MNVPFKFIDLKVPTAEWLDQFPDGDYTIGRGADPRSLAERQSTEPKTVATVQGVEPGPVSKRRPRKPQTPVAAE
jgi:hypothetical protein